MIKQLFTIYTNIIQSPVLAWEHFGELRGTHTLIFPVQTFDGKAMFDATLLLSDKEIELIS